MDAASRDELLAACRVIFGRAFDPSFLGHLQEDGLRTAWRLKALQTHPDRTTDRAAKNRLTGHFIEARQAYHLLQQHLGHRARHHAPPSRAPHQQPAPRPPQQRPPARQRAGTHQRTSAHRHSDQRPTPFYPRRRLRLGEYLYHSRVISFSALIEALVWQRRQRDRFCEVGRRWGYLSDSQVDLLLAGRRPHERIGATARRLRLLNDFQVRTVLTFQQSCQKPLGSFFLQRGLLTPAALRQLLQRFESHNTGFSRAREGSA